MGEASTGPARLAPEAMCRYFPSRHLRARSTIP